MVFVFQSEVFDDNNCHRPGRTGGQGTRGGARSCSVSICNVGMFCAFIINVFADFCLWQCVEAWR